jgi:hypothetical protein
LAEAAQGRGEIALLSEHFGALGPKLVLGLGLCEPLARSSREGVEVGR